MNTENDIEIVSNFISDLDKIKTAYKRFLHELDMDAKLSDEEWEIVAGIVTVADEIPEIYNKIYDKLHIVYNALCDQSN